jgi:hypothetical protein
MVELTSSGLRYSARPLDEKGRFDASAEYAGSDFTVVGNHILCVYRGEFWKSKGQANKIFDYTADGIFVRQFGFPVFPGGGEILNAPGAALNMSTISAAQTGNSIHVYVNDEGGRGVHRWSLAP